MNVHPSLSLAYIVQRDDRIRHILGAATINQGLLTSAEEKTLQNHHHTHIPYVGCSSCEDDIQADALL